ncbi:hypothetical protein LTR56_008711 [Elasticomyces elasticus]|nr:hypothetical protein LTR22_018268 [Elasticomyces elasticus]KAK3646094.1 hypothetical protein LTR56_008711 [Elasticomyces elasticus]KAK4924275.1 hypothetical protein LTR49_008575 [Elasticomyces elasticus]KAK5759166.1 hypothetical protein LTS12_010775 [Elasticomyces elasticus]
METLSLDYRATAVLDQLTSGLSQHHGVGRMSVAIYDTAWVSLVSKTIGSTEIWLFPQSFDYLLATQQDDGSWVSYASSIDGILNTAASLLALQRHCRKPFQTQHDTENLNARIDKATFALQQMLDSWDVASTVHVGFEILVPALLGYLAAEGLCFSFAQHETLMALNQQKMKKFQSEYLYGPHQLTALHSLEAFVGKINFDRVAHHKVNGSFMASPSSTSAYLINASRWDDDCEDYLRHVVAYGAGERSGGVPSAFPSTIFELTWSMSTLLEGGFDLATLAPFHTSRAADFLRTQLNAGKGAVGFAPGLGADADDTSKALLILNLLHHETSLDSLLKHFESDLYFKTYSLERDPSFSANCNVLAALLHAPDPTKYAAQIEKVVRFLLGIYQEQGLNIRDKWNISSLYSLMLLAQAGKRILALSSEGRSGLPIEMLNEQIPQLLTDIAGFTLDSQNSDGSWGLHGSAEQTAYALLILAASGFASHTIRSYTKSQTIASIERGRQFLSGARESHAEYLWVEKVTYRSDILLESYTLAALKATSSYADMNKRDSGIGSPADSPHVGASVASVDPDVAAGGVGEDTPDSSDGAGCLVESPTARDSQTLTPDNTTNAWDSRKEKILLGPYNYLEKNPGKDMRSQFINAFNVWLQVPQERLSVIEKVVRMLHTASLLVDDIEDNSDLRRGRPVAHSIFGTAQTFNSGNYVYFLALDEIRKLGSSQAVDIYVEELLNLHRGQGMDLFWRDTLTCPTEAEYLEMVRNKTGGLFRLAIRLMQSESTTGRDFLPLVDVLGLQFQICDDYLNLMSTTYTQNKGLCEDLTEGKFSFPIIHSVRSDLLNLELINILKQKPHESEIKRYAVAYMESTGSFQYTRQVVKGLSAKATVLLDEYDSQGWGAGVDIRKLLARMSLE